MSTNDPAQKKGAEAGTAGSGGTTNPANTDKPKLIKVKLEKAHTHAGQNYPAGETIEVDESTAEWLRKQKVIL